jgi:hypothetical protein
MQTSLFRALVCASVMLTLSVAAQNSGPASNGDFQFGLEGASGAIQYDARSFGSGARGQITFVGAMDITNDDVDGNGEGGSAVTNVTMSVEVDCLRIVGNRAAMSGVVTSSSVSAYNGAKALLAVEDNGEGKKVSDPDRFTWGLYRSTATTWTPSDAEVPGDNGAMFSWYASDYERNDDTPVLTNTSQNKTVDCSTFPFGSYAFEDVAHGAGEIQVKP